MTAISSFMNWTVKLSVERAPDGTWMVEAPGETLPISKFIEAISHREFSMDGAGDEILSRAERAAMFRFVNGVDYKAYNTLLRDTSQFSRRRLLATLKRVVAMQSGLNKLPDYQGVVYRVAACRDASAANYNGIGAGDLRVGQITTTRTFLGACRFAFVIVEHAPVVLWMAIRAHHATIQPACVEEVTFPLGTPIEISRIQNLDPRRIVAHIEPDAELKWVQIGVHYLPFIGVQLSYDGAKLPDFFFPSAPPYSKLREFVRVMSFTRLLDVRRTYNAHAQRELNYFKCVPPEKLFRELWTSRHDSVGEKGRLPDAIHFVEAEEKPKSGAAALRNPHVNGNRMVAASRT
jgi:hypothetical protein